MTDNSPNDTPPMDDTLLKKLTFEDSRKAFLWLDIIEKIERSTNKEREIARIQADYKGKLKGLSTTNIYARMAAVYQDGLAGLVGKVAMRRVRMAEGLDVSACALPPSFVQWWKELVINYPRHKILPVWRQVMHRLINGEVIPGYECDWRGIWLREHPWEDVPPDDCPYKNDHRAGLHPRGWSYSTLFIYAPKRESYNGQNLRSFLSITHHEK